MAALPLTAGLLSPALQTVGLFIWQNRWKGDALGLNAFKGCFASLFHGSLAIATTVSFRRAYEAKAVGFMILGSMLGIVIADTWWLVALDRLGARKMIAIDAIKPFLAVGFGAWILGDKVPTLALVGVFITTVGIFLVNYTRKKGSHKGDSEVESSDDEAPSFDEVESTTMALNPLPSSAASKVNIDGPRVSSVETTSVINDGRNLTPSGLAIAYLYAVGNVMLDVYAATITVEHHGDLTAADVSLIRFGFAGVVLTLMFGAKECAGRISSPRSTVVRKGPPPPNGVLSLPHLVPMDGVGSMTEADWASVAGGTIFVTVLGPLLNTWVMFKLPLGIAVTLNSTTPLWSLPVAWFHGETLSLGAMAGAAMATCGVALLIVVL